jgi:hypothetical protein
MVLLFFLAASFGVPETLSTVEGSAQLIVCAQMMATPPSAVLGKNVVVNLSTENDTGIANGYSDFTTCMFFFGVIIYKWR